MVDRAFVVYDEIVKAGLTPDKVTFNALISACGRARDLHRAIEALEAITNTNGHSPDRHTHNSWIDACGKSERIDQAFDVYRRMRRAGVKPCVVTFKCKQ